MRESIVNPGRLPAERRDDVCFECHLQPSVALFGVRRFGRGDYSFRPGESLADYEVHVDVDEAGQTRGDRFEINHHPYRLRQSRCYLESGGALSCLTCHDPHVKVPPAERAAHYRAACLTCHQVDQCGRAAMVAAGGAVPAVDPGDCAGCHMAKRRTQDVVQVVMTDHLIRRRPGGEELLAPRAERDPQLRRRRVPVAGPRPGRGPGRRLPGRRRGTGRRGKRRRRRDRPAGAGARRRPPGRARPLSRPRRRPAPPAAVRRGRRRRSTPVLARRSGDDPQAREWLAIARAGQGKIDEAIALLTRLVATDPGRPEAEVNLGRLLAGRGRLAAAVEHYRAAIAARPVQVAAWLPPGRRPGQAGAA